MHWFLHLRVPHFYSGTLLKLGSVDRARGLAVHRDKRLVDLDERARRAGLRAGMSLPEAKTLGTGVQFVEWSEEDFRDSQSRWLDRCVGYADVVEPDGQDAAWLDLSSHPDPADVARSLAADLKASLGWEVRTGLSSVKWIARLASELPHTPALPSAVLAVDRPSEFIAELPVEYLEPVGADIRRQLRFLGYRTIGEVACIPVEVLRGPFGERAWAVHQAARGVSSEEVVRVYPPDSLAARIRFEGGADNREPVWRGVDRLANELGRALLGRDRVGRRLDVTLLEESAPPETLQRKFAKPIACPRTVRSAIRLILGESFARPIVELRARIPVLEVPAKGQRELSGAASRQDRMLFVQRAIGDVRSAFGDRAVRPAADLPVPRRVRVLRAWKDATGWQ
ncbi:MAG: hypothetical protein SNJ61_01990 [Fimbriimonadaceae bacterium]